MCVCVCVWILLVLLSVTLLHVCTSSVMLLLVCWDERFGCEVVDRPSLTLHQLGAIQPLPAYKEMYVMA